MELIDSEEELFLTENCFSQEVLEPNFSMGRTHRCAENFSMIAIVDDEELEKTKGISNTANDTRINTLWTVRVWFESAEERT